MQLRHLWLTDFRRYHQVEVELPAGLTAIVGANGEGKTNLLEARRPTWPRSARSGARRSRPWCARAARRPRCGPRSSARAVSCSSRPSWRPRGRNRIQVNRQRLTAIARPARRAAGLGLRARRPGAGQGRTGRASPLPRRRGGGRPTHARRGAHRGRAGSCASATPCCSQAGGRLDDEVALTLDVWDAKLVDGRRGADPSPRLALLDQLQPAARRPATPAWPAARPRSPPPTARPGSTRVWPRPWRRPGPTSVRRGISLVGPHRDDLELSHRRPAGPHPRLPGRAADPGPGPAPGRPPGGRPSRPGTPPLLLLDDVFSELDPDRSRALLDSPRDRPRRCSPRPAPSRPARCPIGCCGSPAGSVPTRAERPRRVPQSAMPWQPLPVRSGAGSGPGARQRRPPVAGLGQRRRRRPPARCSPTGTRSWARSWPRHARPRSLRNGVLVVAVSRPGLGHPAAVPRGRAGGPDRPVHRVRRGHRHPGPGGAAGARPLNGRPPDHARRDEPGCRSVPVW